MSTSSVFILGGAQSDFSRHWSREGLELFDMLAATVEAAMSCVRIDPAQVDCAHIGNFAAQLYCRQGHLGGLFATLRPEFDGLPTSRHEAACASGSIAALAAAADIEAGRYDLACVVGLEMMRNVSSRESADFLGTAAWLGHEFADAVSIWPRAFSDLTQEYERRYGIDYRHIGRIAEINFANARRNPNAQTRAWKFNERSFTCDDGANPVVEGVVRRNDCSQITDGAAVVFLASERFADEYRRHTGPAAKLARIDGWGHRTATMRLVDKLARSAGQRHVLPHVNGVIKDAFKRADIAGVEHIDAIEMHDCFAMTEYMAIDHFDITPPGESWQAVEDGSIEIGGRIPINPSGGLIGAGHPVGATGVRMLLDAWKQVTNQAGDYQVEAARRVATLNIGGSATTAVSFVVGATDR